MQQQFYLSEHNFETEELEINSLIDLLQTAKHQGATMVEFFTTNDRDGCFDSLTVRPFKFIELTNEEKDLFHDLHIGNNIEKLFAEYIRLKRLANE